MIDKDQIADALGDVTDPDLGSDVRSAGLVTDVSVTDGVVTVTVELAGLDPDRAESIVEEIRSTVLSTPEVEQVRVDGEEPDADASRAAGIEADRIVAVASAKGGVGKSTVATSLARGLAEQGEAVGIFDADIHGPNVPQLLDVDGPVVATDDGRAAPIEAAGLSVMSLGLLDNDAPIAWRGAMAHEALLDLLTDTAWDGLDTLVVDLPPGTGDIVLTTLQDVPVDGVVLVTTPYPTAVDDTGRSATLFRENGVPILGAVVNMAGFTCPTCGDDHDLFGHESIDLDAPVLATLPFDETMRDPTTTLPEEIESLATAVAASVDESGFDVPETALDVSGLPAGVRLELVTDEFAALDVGEELTVLNDDTPESLLAALGADSHRGGADKPHDGCQCHDATSHEGIEAGSRTDVGPVEHVDVERLGPETWAFRVEKGVHRETDEQIADA